MILKLAVVYGTANAGRLLEKIKNGEKQYHFVEVMTCPEAVSEAEASLRIRNGREIP